MNRGLSILVLAASAAAIPLISCASIPPGGPAALSDADWWGVFPEEVTFYVYGKTGSHAELLNALLLRAEFGEQEIQALLDNTEKFVAAAKLNGDAKPFFSAVAFGTYSSIFMGMQMNMNAEWEPRQNPHQHWMHRKSGTKIAFPNDNMILLSNGDLEHLFSHIQHPRVDFVPLELAYQMRVSDVVLYFPRFPQELMQSMNIRMEIPVEQLWLSLENNTDNYSLAAVFHLPTEEQARSFPLAGKLVLMSWLKEARIQDLSKRLKTISFVSEGKTVRMTGLDLPTEEFTEKSVAFLGTWLHEHVNGGASR